MKAQLSAVCSSEIPSRAHRINLTRFHFLYKLLHNIFTLIYLYLNISLSGKALQCEADVIRDIRFLDKVPPAMLVSAQACVAKSMEENW